MTETNVLPEDVALAEEINAAYSEYEMLMRSGAVTPDLPNTAALIAAHRPPLVARLVEENARLRAVMEKIARMVCWQTVIEQPAKIGCKCFSCSARAALSPAPTLDLAEIERALEAAEGHLADNLTDHRMHPIGHCPTLDLVRAALASLREVTHVR